VSRAATVAAALAAADLAEARGDLRGAAELLTQAEGAVPVPEGRTFDARRLRAVEAHTAELYEPRSRGRA
jgi:hypothetical protein